MNDPNLPQLELAAAHLQPMLDDLMLVGGCAAGLLVTDPAAPDVRTTTDVDVAVEVATLAEYNIIQKRLTDLGFEPGQEPGDPICRWRTGSLAVDVMPLEEKILGFRNRWYRSAMRCRSTRRLRNALDVFHIDAPHFLASKLEAYSDRGHSDPVMSHDLEDMVRVVDGRRESLAELAASSNELRNYVAAEVRACMRDRYFVALPEYFPRGEGDQRVQIVIKRLEEITRLA
jgi:predicted nucleotidyltransferase